jgi:hypothetical protein
VAARTDYAVGVAAIALTCRAGNETVEARVSVGSAEATVARDDLPTLIASSAVVLPEDLAADRVEPALKQVTEGLADDRIGGMVLHVGTP